MSEYRIFETDEFLKKVAKFSSPDARFIREKLNNYVYPQIRKVPFFGNNIKKLRAYSPDTWRYRIGKFRLFYTVDEHEHIVFILTLDFRRDAYR